GMTPIIAEAAHWGLALVPVLVLLAIFISLDAFKLMRFGEILLLLVLGGIGAGIAWPIAGRFLDTLPIGFSSYSRFVAPWLEEAIKAAIMILLFRFPDYGAGTWLVRGFGTAVMHGTTLAVLAAIAHEFAERETREAAGDFDFHLWWFAPGYLAAVALHTTFNQFPDRPMLAMLGAILFAPIALVGIFYFGTAEAERWLVAERAEHRAQVECLRSGGWPDTPAGRKIAALAERLGPEATARIRRY